MCSIVDGVAQSESAGTRFAYNGTRYTIDGHEREEYAVILAKISTHGSDTKTKSPNYIRKDWLHAQLLFWGYINDQKRKDSYNRDRMMRLLTSTPRVKPVGTYR